MISERLRDTYVMWSDPNSPYCDGTPHGAEVVLDAADVIDALVAALDTFVSEYVELVNSGDAGFWEPDDEPKVKAARSALAMARRK
jgi:hypothetical protein